MKNIIKKFFRLLTIVLILFAFIICYKTILTSFSNVDYVSILGYTYEVSDKDVDIVKITDNVRGNDYIYYKADQSKKIKKTKLLNINNGVFNTKDGIISKGQIIGKVNFDFPLLLVYILVPIYLVIYIVFFIVFKKDILSKENKYERKDIPDDLFRDSKASENVVTGLTVTISIKDMEILELDSSKETKNNKEEIEILDIDDYFNDKQYDLDKETIDIIMSILKCRNNSSNSRINKEWLEKYQYVYRLVGLLLNDNYDDFVKEVKNPSFKEIYNYDLDRIGLTKVIRNKIYNLPIFGLLRLLIYSILYNDEVLFDGIYKILKYKVKNDSLENYISSKRIYGNSKKELKSLLNYMRDISNKFDNKNVFNLDKIDKLIKIKNY